MQDIDSTPAGRHLVPEDWLSTTYEEVTDPEHLNRWLRVVKRDPDFAREILEKALLESRSKNPVEMKKFVDAMIWVADVYIHSEDTGLTQETN